MSTATANLSPRRRRTRERKLGAIVDAALDIIEEDSLDSLTMARLAKAVDVTAGALYRYFPSKAALIAALEARTIERVARLLDGQRRQWLPHLPADEREAALCELLACAGFYLDLAARDVKAFRLIAATLGEPRPLVDDEGAEQVAAPLRELLLGVSLLFDNASTRGALGSGSAPLRTIVFWTSLHGVVSTAKLDRLSQGEGWFAPTRLANELTTALLVGWGAAPDTVAAAQAWQQKRQNTYPSEWTPS